MIGPFSLTPMPGAAVEASYIWLATIVPDQTASIILPSGSTAESVGARPVSSRRAFPSSGAPVVTGPTLYFASEDWTSGPTDPVAANRWYDGRLDNTGSLSWAMPLLPSSESLPEGSNIGRISLTNTDGMLDDLPDRLGMQNARVTLAVIPRGGTLAQAVTLWVAVVSGMDVGPDVVEIDLLPLASVMDQPITVNLYAGTGGMEGPAALTGTQKPIIYGTVYNTAPVLIEPLTYIFQLHDGALAQITAVRFGGVAMTFTADYPTYAALAAAAVATGSYATCLAQGLVKAGLTQGGANDSFTLTADAQTTETRAVRLARDLVTVAAGLFALTVDTASFNAVDTALGANSTYGQVVTEPLTWLVLLNNMLGSVGASWGSRRDGQIGVVLPAAPTAGASVLTLTDASLLAVDRLALPEGFRWPFSRQSIQYGYNWSVQTNLAAIVRDAALSREWRVAVVQGPGGVAGALAPDNLLTYLRSLASAQAAANRALALHGVARRMVSAVVPLQVGLLSAWSVVTVDYPRFGLSGGKPLAVVAVDEDYANGTMTLTLWG